MEASALHGSATKTKTASDYSDSRELHESFLVTIQLFGSLDPWS